MCEGVEEARIIERAAGDDLMVGSGKRETGTGSSVIDFVLPRAKAEELSEFIVDPRAFCDAVNLCLQPRPVIEAEGAQAGLPCADLIHLGGLGAGDEIAEQHGDVGVDLTAERRALLAA